MRNAFALSLLVVAVAAVPLAAQTKFSMSGKCAKPDVQHAVPAPDAPDHVMTLSQGKCVPVKPVEFGGSPGKEAVFTEHGDVRGNSSRVSGTYVETLANGEKVYYRYQGTAVLQGGALQTMQNKWQIDGATARLKGLKGQGTCSGKGTPEGGLAFDCQGEYTLPK
jgi:hypothetical protein